MSLDWQLGELVLARGDLDRATIQRADAGWVAAAWADPATRVVVLHKGRAPVRFTGAVPAAPASPAAGAGTAAPAPAGHGAAAELVLVPPADAPPGTRFLLGVDEQRTAYFGVVSAESPPPPADGPPVPASEPVARPAAAGEVRQTGLREAGPLLADRDAGLFTHALALANWHTTHTHCPRCGATTEPLPAGHTRVCTADGSEHFPRTDPAVIMLVADAADRCLLARNARWPERRVSILAGFVEPGESAEQAVIREVAEETGIAVTGVRYVGSQPWPMPQSLMLGFRAQAESGQEFRLDEEEITEARWFSREGLRAAHDTGEILLPPPVSIARRIIEAWYGAPLP